ncbi:MAG: hypothetical protein NTW32_20875 [Chloroflexi bacterium]|nr:hypothetical protein [Chloroflexota bacterium]
MLDHSQVIVEKVIWKIGTLRIVEVRIFTTLEILTYRIEKQYDNASWHHEASRNQLINALLYVKHVFGINIQEGK